MLLQEVQNTLATYRMIRPSDRVLVAVSGGPDSVALCHLLNRLRHSQKIDLVVAHVHHGLRGAAAEEDASFVQDFGNRLGLPVASRRLDVRSWQKKHGSSLQMAARVLRYRCLKQLMTEEATDKVALGHNADDQAEEILLRLFRGAGQRGLTGMPACTREGVIRPLLKCHRSQIMAYLQSHGLTFRQDASNLEPWCQRNLLRLSLLPIIQRDFNSNLNATLLRTSRIFEEDQDYWESLLQAWLGEHVQAQDMGGLRIPIAQLLETHPAMQRRLLRRSVEKVSGNLTGFGFRHTEILMALCRSSSANSQVQLPGELVAEKNYNWLTVALQQDSPEDFHYEIPGPGVHPLPLLNQTMEVQRLFPGEQPRLSTNPADAFMDGDRVSF
ncbi:MAG: tRNA lysidine(34) synthetase TilS, partial [Deltaproteobacteria bacterium]